LSAAQYLIGWALLAVVFVPLAYAAWSIRARTLPGWAGAHARLAEFVAGLSLLVVVAFLLGAVGCFTRAGVVLGVLGASAIGIALGSRGRGRSAVSEATATERDASVGRASRLEVGAAIAGVTVVLGQWAGKVLFSLSNGMTHPDSVWYHAPYAATFAQRHHLLIAPDPSDPLHAYANHTSEMVHALLDLVFGRDLLSPLVNVAWFGIAILAAWCLGKRWGAGPLCVLGVALVCGLPTVEATHPGQASNDLAAAAMLLTAVALLSERELAFTPLAFAALAAGLALGLKITTAAPIAVLTIGVIVLGIRRKRWQGSLIWIAGLVLTGSYWFIRNIKTVHNPLPYYDLHLGPITLKAQLHHHAEALSRYFFDGEKWRGLFLPGLHFGFGWAYPVVLALALAGLVLGLWRAPTTLHRLGALAYLVGLVAFVFTPYTADGGGLAFKFNLRYMIPSLLGAVVYYGFAFRAHQVIRRWIVITVMLAVIVIDLFARNYERVPAWPSQKFIAVPATVVGVGAILAVWRFVIRPQRWRALRTIAVALFALGLVIGWPIQHHYFDHRYVHAHLPIDVVYAPFRDIRHSTVAYYGTLESYPFYGPDLSNHVELGPRPPAGGGVGPCRAWLEMLSRFRYIAIAHQVYAYAPPDDAIARDRSVSVVATDGSSTLYRVDGPLTANAC
jgi:hypothetical protein